MLSAVGRGNFILESHSDGDIVRHSSFIARMIQHNIPKHAVFQYDDLCQQNTDMHHEMLHRCCHCVSMMHTATDGTVLRSHEQTVVHDCVRLPTPPTLS